MAEVEEEEYEVKDEELVDFEGSDYGFESAEEEEGEESGVSGHKRFENERPRVEDVVDASEKVVEVGGVAVGVEKKEGAESGEIEEEKDEREGVVVQPAHKVVVVESRQRKPRKPDLEDGELDDAAMPEGSDPEAEANGGEDDEDDKDRRERKRRKDRFAAERHLENKERKDAEELALAQSRHYRGGRGSDKMHAGRGNNSFRGLRGSNATAPNRANLGPGIMGPGRPPVPMEFGGPIPMRSMGRGFPRPIGSIVAPGRPNQNEINMQNHIRESMAAQEHMLRSHQQMMQMAQGQVQAQQAQAHAQAQAQAQAQVHAQAQAQQAHAHAQAHMANSGPLRAPMNGSPMRPLMSLDFIGGQVQASHSMMHMQVAAPDSGQQINFPRPMEGFGRRVPQGLDPFSAGRGAVGGAVLNQPSNRVDSSLRAGAGRQQNAWSSSPPVTHDLPHLSAGRGRGQGQGQGQGQQGQGRGQVMSPLWGDPQVAGIPTGFPSPLGVIGHAVAVNVGSGMAPAGMMALGTPKRQGSLPIVMPGNMPANRDGNTNMKRVDVRAEPDGTWRVDGGNRGGPPNSNGLAPHSRAGSGVWSNSPVVAHTGSKRSRESGLDRRHSFGGSMTGAKTVPLGSGGNGLSLTAAANAGNHLIQLGGPVTKSRVVSVSGFPENTSMAVVVEAFEKQGKILDFKKDERGNAFHITFSSVPEAVSAKRSLHRSLLNGRQITVEYAVQPY